MSVDPKILTQTAVVLDTPTERRYRAHCGTLGQSVADRLMSLVRDDLAGRLLPARPGSSGPDRSGAPLDASVLDPEKWYSFEISGPRRADYTTIVGQPLVPWVLGSEAFITVQYRYKGPGKTKPVIRQTSFNVKYIVSVESAPAPEDGTRMTLFRRKSRPKTTAEQQIEQPTEQPTEQPPVPVKELPTIADVFGHMVRDSLAANQTREAVVVRPDFSKLGTTQNTSLKGKTAWEWLQSRDVRLMSFDEAKFRVTEELTKIYGSGLDGFFISALVKAARHGQVPDCADITRRRYESSKQYTKRASKHG
jgi:hypothetical protein